MSSTSSTTQERLIGTELQPGLLSSPQIEYCIKKYNIIEFAELENINASVYAMRLGGHARRWENKKKLDFFLAEDDSEKPKFIQQKHSFSGKFFEKKIGSLVLPPNSLTFVTTIEKFNLPRNLIARFNLKSSWVHKGILLGTGPIVDPGFTQRIVIPLHNFSNDYIYINYGEQLINVEFTITHNPDAEKINDVDVKKLENKNYNKDENQYFKATDYKESSIRSYLNIMQKSINRIRNIGLFTIVALGISFLGLLFYILTVAWDSNKQTISTRNYIESVKKDIQSGDISEIAEIKQELTSISAQIKALEIDRLNFEKIDELNKRIAKLEEIIGNLDKRIEQSYTPLEVAPIGDAGTDTSNIQR